MFGVFTKVLWRKKIMLLPNKTTPYFQLLLLDFSLTVKAATLIFISGCGSAISSAITCIHL